MIKEKSSVFRTIHYSRSFLPLFFLFLSSLYATAGVTFSIHAEAQTENDSQSFISSNNDTATLIEGTNYRQDISGKYSNADYGIVNLDIPQGWYASEGMFGNKGIGITMHPGTSDEFLNRLIMGENNETIPIMSFIVVDRQEMKERQVMSQDMSSSLKTDCTETQPNSTTTIGGKAFNISSMKCTTTDQLAGQLGNAENVDESFIDMGSTEIFKRYEYEIPTRIYTLQLTLSSEYSPNASINETEIAKFTPILDKTIETLKLSN